MNLKCKKWKEREKKGEFIEIQLLNTRILEHPKCHKMTLGRCPNKEN